MMPHMSLSKILVGVYAGYTTGWCSEAYVDIPLSPMGHELYTHKLSPHHLAYQTCSYALYITMSAYIYN